MPPQITIATASGPLSLTPSTQDSLVPVLITGTGTVTGSSYGIAGDASAAWSIVNDGTINGSNVAAGRGIYLNQGGSVTNGSASYAAASITGGVQGVRIVGAAGTVTNAGTITGNNGPGIALQAGGEVTNGASGMVLARVQGSYNGVAIYGSAGTVVNYATIAAAAHNGVSLAAGGVVSNLGTAALISSGGNGIYTDIAGVPGGATIINEGTITASGFSIYLGNGGTVTNSGAASRIDGNGVYIRGAGSVTNEGSITSGGSGVYLRGGRGAVTNASGASISGSRIGVDFSGGAGTLVNAGTISGGSAAVLFNDFAGNRLVVDPGAVFTGSVFGGRLSDTIELATGTGTLTGIGSTITGFEAAVVDVGASWDLGTVTGSVAFTVQGGALSLAADALDAGTSFDLSNIGAATLTLNGLGAQTSFANAITGVAIGDTIAVSGTSFASGDTAVYELWPPRGRRLRRRQRRVHLQQSYHHARYLYELHGRQQRHPGRRLLHGRHARADRAG